MCCSINPPRLQDGDTALHWAAKNGHARALVMLMQGGADPNIKGEESGCTALHLAAKAGHEIVVATLLKYGAKFNIQSRVSKSG